ncbi:MAG: ornithine cyclodeaminase family protein [Gammaproteobacteria bacterium]|nr:ornithine cyclodeaminase family protein [Gammaproteobacteria bacterium]
MIDADGVRRLLDYEGCIAAVRKAMSDFSVLGTPQPLRNIHRVSADVLLGTMPGSLAAPGGMGAKLASVVRDPDHPGHNSHNGVVVLMDRNTGIVTCVADATEITRIRTAAASAVATAALARPDAARLAIFGCGHQAESHIHAIMRVRQLEEVLVWGRRPGSAASFAGRLAEATGIPVIAIRDGEEAAARADIICTVTCADTPVLYGKWVKPGTHVNVVGSSYAGPTEVDSELVCASRYFVDSRESALVAAAEFLIARDAGLIDATHILGEIGEVLAGRVAGRTSDEQITVYKSLGHVVQDLAAAAYIRERVGPCPASA